MNGYRLAWRIYLLNGNSDVYVSSTVRGIGETTAMIARLKRHIRYGVDCWMVPA